MVKISEGVRKSFMEKISNYLAEQGEEVLLVKSGTYSIPWARGDDEGYINITFSIPKGSRDSEGYNGHEEAQNYEFEQVTKAKEKAKKEVAKKKKIERDAKLRAKKKEGQKGE